MTTQAITLIEKAAALLFDEGYDRFSVSDWITFINDGQSEAVLLKPDVYVESEKVLLQSGVEQTLEAGKIQLIRLLYNYGSGGAERGSAILAADIDRFNQAHPDWPSHTPNANVQFYMYDPKMPKRYFVYPPQPSADQGYVQRVVSADPPKISGQTSYISIDDAYAHLLLHYMQYRAHMINAKHSAAEYSLAMEQWNAFAQGLGRKDLIESIYKQPKAKRERIENAG